MAPEVNQTRPVDSGMMPMPPRISGATMPATPSIAQRPWITSEYASHWGFTKPPAPSGSDMPSGSKPKSPGRVPSRYVMFWSETPIM